VGGLVTYLAGLGNVSWIVPIVFACTAVAAAWVYLEHLKKLDAYGWLHRDALFEELQKKI
jgi:hypothetical protein